MALVPDQKFSTFQNGGTPTTGDIIVGLRGGINTKFNWVLPSTVDTITGTANQVLVNGSTGTPVAGDVTLSAPQDIATTSSPTFQAVQVNFINDSNGLPVVAIADTLSSVNYLTIASGIAGANANIVASGASTDIGINYSAKNAGGHSFSSTSVTPIAIFSGTALQHETVFQFANTAANRTVTWPDADGTVAFTSGASGIVSPGLINQLAYYAAAGTTVSGLAIVNNAGLLTDGAGLPRWVAYTGTGSPVLGTSPLITTPMIAQINDVNGNASIALPAASNAVNYITVTNTATGGIPRITATGADPTIPIIIASKSIAQVYLLAATATSPIQFLTGTSAQNTAIFNFPNTAASQTYTWPAANGNVTLNTTGTWTPVLTGTSGGSATYSSQVGNYTVIGNRLFFDCFIAISGSTLSGSITIAGLPIAATAQNFSASIWANTLGATATPSLSVLIQSGANFITLWKYVSGGSTALTNVDIGTACTLVITGSYAIS